MLIIKHFKPSLVALILIISAFTSNAQVANSNRNAPSSFYLNLSSGIDNFSGLLGIGALIPINDQVGLRFGAGLGGWGGKFSGGIKVQNLKSSGMGFGIGYSHCTGFKDFDLILEDRNGDSRTVNVDLNSVGSLNFTVNKNWMLKPGILLYAESGYAVATGGNDFYKINDGSTLNSDEELILHILRPGGLILSIGILIGL